MEGLDRLMIISFSNTSCQEMGNKQWTVGKHVGSDKIKGRIRDVMKDIEEMIQRENRMVICTERYSGRS